MSLTLANAVTQVRYVLNESSPAFWTDAEIQTWVQEGVEIISSKTLMAEKDDTISPLIASQLSYSSSDETWIGDMIEPYAVIYFDGTSSYKGLVKVHPRQIGNVATFTAGPPKYYTLHNRKLYFWPLATSVEVDAGATIQVLYSCETNDITELKDEFQHLAILYATGRAKQKDQKFAEASTMFTQFYNEVNFERSDKHVRETDSVESFKIPRRGGQRGGS